MDIALSWREEQGWIVLESEVGHGGARYVFTITAVVCAAHTGKAPPLWLMVQLTSRLAPWLRDPATALA